MSLLSGHMVSVLNGDVLASVLTAFGPFGESRCLGRLRSTDPYLWILASNLWEGGKRLGQIILRKTQGQRHW